MRAIFYTLADDGKTPVPATSYPSFVNETHRRVALWDGIFVRVSTVFMYLDHQFGEGPPLLWETMVFPNGDWSELCTRRYSTYDDALAGHNALVTEWKVRQWNPKICGPIILSSIKSLVESFWSWRDKKP